MSSTEIQAFQVGLNGMAWIASVGRRGAGRRGSDFLLPNPSKQNDQFEFLEQERAGASSIQLKKASLMYGFGLRSKARRQASCRVYGRKRSCENGHQFYERYDCKCRYCLNASCGRKSFLDLFKKYLRLEPVAQTIAPGWDTRPHRKPLPGDQVIAKIDITIRNLGRMPSNEEVRRFNADIRRLFRSAENFLGLRPPNRFKFQFDQQESQALSTRTYGVLWTDEFGGKATRRGKTGNTNLHAHAVYSGPHLPQKWLSEEWARIRGDGSKIVSIKIAKTFRAGLYHALKYAGKFLSTDPCRLAELELAFHRIRRVHTMAGFYNAIPKDSQLKTASLPCPTCGGTMFDASGPLSPIKNFTALGIRDLELWRREVGRLRVLASPT